MPQIKNEFYQIIIEAQKLDADGDHQEAFVQYLNGINSLISYLKNETNIQSIGTTEIDSQLTNGVNTLRHCVDRLHELCSPEKLTQNLRDSKDSKDDTNQLNQNKTIQIPQNEPTFLSNFSPVTSPTTSSSSSLAKAYKENTLLNKVFNHRLKTIKDPLKRATLQLELQRRLTENIQLAKARDFEKYHQEHLRERKALEEAAKKLLEQQHLLNNKITESNSLLNRQNLYAKILQYEESLDSQVDKFRCKTINPDLKEINDITSSILCHQQHPLCKWMKKFHYQMQNHIEPLLSHYIKHRLIREEHNLLDPDDLLFNYEDNLSENIQFKIDKLEIEALERHFNNIAQDISSVHETITLLLTLIMFDNKQYYSQSNIDLLQHQHFVLHTISSDYLYQPIWSLINNLFRIVYWRHEHDMKTAMQETIIFHELQSSEWPSVDPQTIDEASRVLKSIIPLQTPYAKLKTMVRMMQKLCTEIKSNQLGLRSNSNDSLVGADELVPVLCLVVLKTSSPQLISECYAIEQLVDSKYLLGEEGYCLSSIQTALKFIEMNANSNK